MGKNASICTFAIEAFFRMELVKVSLNNDANQKKDDLLEPLPRMAPCTQKLHVMIPEFEGFRKDLRACFLVTEKTGSKDNASTQLEYKLPIGEGRSPEYRMQNIINGAEKNPGSYKNFYVNWIRNSIFEDPEIVKNLLNAIILNAHCPEAVVHAKTGLVRPDGVTVFLCIVMSANKEMLDFFNKINLLKTARKWMKSRPLNTADILALSLFEKRVNPEIVENYYPEILKLVDGWQSFYSGLTKNTEAFNKSWFYENPAWNEIFDMQLLRGVSRKIGRRLDWKTQRKSSFENLCPPSEITQPVPMGFVWVCMEFIDRHIDDLLSYDAEKSIPELKGLINHYLGKDKKSPLLQETQDSTTEFEEILGVLDPKSDFYELATKRFGDYRDKIDNYEQSLKEKKTSPKQDIPFWGI